jgi:hypothetical protein
MEKYLPVKVHNIDKPYSSAGSYHAIMVDRPSPYVDKTLIIDEFLSALDISLVLRPRRFGKSINLSMLCEFFSIQNCKETTEGITKETTEETTEETTKGIILEQLFGNTLIHSKPSFKEWAGTRPVIHVSFHVGPITTLQ